MCLCIGDLFLIRKNAERNYVKINCELRLILNIKREFVKTMM